MYKITTKKLHTNLVCMEIAIYDSCFFLYKLSYTKKTSNPFSEYSKIIKKAMKITNKFNCCYTLTFTKVYTTFVYCLTLHNYKISKKAYLKDS